MTGRQQYNIIRGNRYTPRYSSGPLWATILNLKGETAFEPLGPYVTENTYIRSVYFYFTVPLRFYACPRWSVGPWDTGTDDYDRAGRKIISLLDAIASRYYEAHVIGILCAAYGARFCVCGARTFVMRVQCRPNESRRRRVSNPLQIKKVNAACVIFPPIRVF